MKKRLLTVIIGCTSMFSLTGCSLSEVSNLEKLEPMCSEADIDVMSLSSTVDSDTYSNISKNQLIDTDSLDDVPEQDVEDIKSFMDKVDSQLHGGDDGVLDNNLTSYLYFEFEKTPYNWKRDKMEIRGMDATSRNVVVDVTYKTDGSTKSVQSPSSIVLGEPSYEQKVAERYESWSEYVQASKKGKNASQALDSFNSKYGASASQSLAEQLKSTKSVKTYNCMVGDNKKDNATMTIRYIITPRYKLGVNLGLSCEHLYLLNYTLDKDVLSEDDNSENSVLVKNINDVLYRYYRALGEDNHTGLYTLVSNYANWNEYFNDYFKTTYRSNGGYTISLNKVEGTSITCTVELSRKVRALGSDMSYPCYKETYQYELELSGDKLKIVDEQLLSSELNSEPAIKTADADTSGFKSDVTLSNSDKEAIQKQIANLGVVQLTGDYSSSEFGDVVDLSISNASLSSIKEALGTVADAEKKVIWLTCFNQGYSNFASVSLKELYQKDSGELVECNSTLDLVKKDVWLCYNYKVNSVSKLSTKELTTVDSICTVTARGIDTINIQSSGEDSDSDTNDSTKRESIVVNY